MTFHRALWALLALAVPALFCAAAPRHAAAAEKIVYGMPGVPPVFVAVLPYVARDHGFFKKYDVDVDLRPFESGAAATQAVVSGAIDAALTPTALLIRMNSNANANLVGIFGHEHPDWLLGATDAAKANCNDIKGQGVGVDSIGGARALALQQLLVGCSLKMPDIKEVALSNNVAAAMAAGQLVFGVLHIDDVPIIEREGGKKVVIIKSLVEVNPGTHYITMAVKRESLTKKRDALVRMLAAQIEAVQFMRNPANADKVAESAKVSGHKPEDAKVALKRYNEMEFWPNNHVGLSQTKFEKDTATQVKVGGIKEGKAPTPYDQLTDKSLYDEAMKLVKKR